MIKSAVALLCCCWAIGTVSSSVLAQPPEPPAAGDLAPLGSYQSYALPAGPCSADVYTPYTYPAFESCPCGADGCFHPWPYYGGGKNYRRNWFDTWLRAHLGFGSMLDAYPCRCLFPAAH